MKDWIYKKEIHMRDDSHGMKLWDNISLSQRICSKSKQFDIFASLTCKIHLQLKYILFNFMFINI